ncbi:hypothetical protein DASC09_004390 [Saccharomycopsis crataegensis]|uniref:Thioredoxin domain-containing protein n=1 Tax=Saccharomycopsis crataegensis TaxID=43959 RepID=A0AAV5QEH2_9ASCO|nr:hypothetical protein DASC09_004390 [Saccharomycopsis crataegensis]
MFSANSSHSLLAKSICRGVHRSFFHTSRASLINIGQKLPVTTVFESSPGNKLNLLDAITSKSIIVGVPGAFSPGCSASHIPGYIANLDKFKQKGIDQVFVVAVNDAFVTNAWKQSLNAPEEMRFIADATGDLTEELDLSFDATAFFGNFRSKRYALVVDNEGKVENLFVEPDNVSVNVSSAENVLKMC